MEELFFRRIDDMIARAEGGGAAYSGFLNESEAARAERYLAGRLGDELCYSFFGGFDGAVRTRLFIYPYYYELQDISSCIHAIEIKGSGYAALRHSSYLGALTSLGIDRSGMGDIVIKDNSAVLFCDEVISRFLTTDPSPLERVGRDKVSVTEYCVEADFCAPTEFKDIFDTVASPRLDAVVASLASVSRERAKAMVGAGLVQINHIEEERPDRVTEDGDTVTIRGTGKFIIISINTKTKKDRHKLIAKKYM